MSKMFEDTFQGEMSEEQVYFRQLLMITGLSSRIYLDASTEWPTNCRNYVAAIDNMESTAIRHLDSDYKEKLHTIIKHARTKLIKFRQNNPTKSNTSIGKEFEVAITMYYARQKLALIMRTLDDKGVFSQKSYNAIEMPTKDEIEEEAN